MKTMTVKHGGVVHLTTSYSLKESADQPIVTFCSERINRSGRGWVEPMHERIPTCPSCLFVFFQRHKTNFALLKREREQRRRNDIVLNMLSHLIGAQQKDSKEQTVEYKEGSYHFIPNTMGMVINQFLLLKSYLDKHKDIFPGRSTYSLNFLDAGCGIGNIMLAARMTELAGRCDGIEYYKETVKRGRTWLNAKQREVFNIIEGDILKFKDYKEYDIIYFYCPFNAGYLETVFEERLEDEMRVGSILIAHLKQSGAIHKDKRFKQLFPRSKYGLGDRIWLKVSDGPRKQSNVRKGDMSYVLKNRPGALKKYGKLLED